MVKQAKRVTRLRGHRDDTRIHQHFINRAHIREVAVQLTTSLVDQQQSVDEVLWGINRAKKFVAIGEIVLALQNQKARQ